MNYKHLFLFYLFIFSSSTAQSESLKVKKNEAKITLKVRINKKIELSKSNQKEAQIQEDTIIPLLESASYDDLKAEIFKKIFKKQKKNTYQIAIYRDPPSSSNRLFIEYEEKFSKDQKKVIEQNIRNNDQLYAIIYSKNAQNDDTITIFVDYEYSRKTMILLIPKIGFTEEKLLDLAVNSFIELINKEGKSAGLRKHLEEETDAKFLLYPDEIEKLATRFNVSAFSLLQNGDRVTLRIHKPKKVELNITAVGSKKDEKIVVTFGNHVYLHDIVKYLQEDLNWNIYPHLYIREEKNEQLYTRFRNDWRLANIPYFNDNKQVYVRKRAQTNDEKKVEESVQNNKKHSLFLVINKRSTSSDKRLQNRLEVSLDDGWRSQKVSILTPSVKKSLKYVQKGKKYQHNYWNIKNRLILYLGKPNGQISKMEDISSTFQLFGVWPGDTVFAIVASDKNPNQVSFFVKNDHKIILMTETIDSVKKQHLARYEIGIRKKAISLFKSMSITRDSELTLWDSTILDKTELLLGKKKSLKELVNGDVIHLKLKDNYEAVTVVINPNNDDYFTIGVAVPKKATLRYILEEAQKQTKWDDSVKRALFIEGASQPLDLDSSLEKAGISGNTPLYIKDKADNHDSSKSREEVNMTNITETLPSDSSDIKSDVGNTTNNLNIEDIIKPINIPSLSQNDSSDTKENLGNTTHFSSNNSSPMISDSDASKKSLGVEDLENIQKTSKSPTNEYSDKEQISKMANTTNITPSPIRYSPSIKKEIYTPKLPESNFLDIESMPEYTNFQMSDFADKVEVASKSPKGNMNKVANVSNPTIKDYSDLEKQLNNRRVDDQKQSSGGNINEVMEKENLEENIKKLPNTPKKKSWVTPLGIIGSVGILGGLAVKRLRGDGKASENTTKQQRKK